jgi:hypothetical protein
VEPLSCTTFLVRCLLHHSLFYVLVCASAVPQTVKASVLLYRYSMHSEDADCDLKRTLAQGTYRLVHQWDLSAHAQSVTATSCINSVLSPLIFTATSDK